MSETTNKISKSELKRQLKAEKKAKEKLEKEKQRAENESLAKNCKPKKTDPELANNGDNEESLDPNEYYKIRSQTVATLKSSGQNPYPHKFHVSIALSKFIEKYSFLKNGNFLDFFYAFMLTNISTNLFSSLFCTIKGKF